MPYSLPIFVCLFPSLSVSLLLGLFLNLLNIYAVLCGCVCVAMVNTYAHFQFNRIKLSNTRPTDHYGVQQHESRLDYWHQIVQSMHTMLFARVHTQYARLVLTSIHTNSVLIVMLMIFDAAND